MAANSDSDDIQGRADDPRILYLAHDLDDAAIWRRVAMLRMGRAEVTVAGFRRGTGPLPEPALVLGQTHNAQMAQRVLSVLKQRFRLQATFAHLSPPDVILCRNLEMLALAVPLCRALARDHPVRLVYEVLDIHRLMLGPSTHSRILRRIERHLCRNVDQIIVSSPAFQREYFEPYGQCDAPFLLVENKVFLLDTVAKPVLPPDRPVLRIGWFGILRCKFSLQCLDGLTRTSPGRYRVVMRGRPALDELPAFHDVVDANPDLCFEGPYAYPDDLARIYAGVDLAWLIDQYDTGQNSDWLLPNRLYESGCNAVPPMALAGTETARRLEALGIGLIIEKAAFAAVAAALETVSPETQHQLRLAESEIPETTWLVTRQDCYDLVKALCMNPKDRVDGIDAAQVSVLIVVPALNEAAHIGGVINGLTGFLQRRLDQAATTRLVIADGGSTDGTQQIVRDHITRLPQFDIRLLDNPDRLQSAGLNAACDRFSDGMDWLVRMDAHSEYPDDYVDVLLQDAARTKAASVVVAMHAVGRTGLQRVIALTQNARLGNGGSAHRIGGRGRFVDHGHHALMRLDAFRAVDGYDPDFSHNEDAELDLRLTRAGHRIWLTGRTGVTYFPRRSIPALFLQYVNFGRGRARTTLKHRLKPRLRQMAMIALAPAVGLAVLTPVSAIFALPAVLWVSVCLGAGAMLAVGQRKGSVLAAGPVAATMHLGWSLGFWQQVLTGSVTGPQRRALAASANQPTDLPAHIAVGLCTFRRDSLDDTLASLEQQDLPEGTQLTIIVADNDDTPSARGRVRRFAETSRHRVVYRFAPSGNISVARNAALEEAERHGISVFAFIDDDELAPSDWVCRLAETLCASGADAVVGPVRAIYPTGAPRWMQDLRVHDTIPELTLDGRPIAGHSCNVIMDLSRDALGNRRFDVNRGVSGGEDTAFFNAAMEQGAQLVFAPKAWLDEPVVPARATLGWLLKRRFRMGQTHGSLLREHHGLGGRFLAVLPAAAKVLYCFGLALLTAPIAARRNANLLRGALHCGTIAALLGIRAVHVYGAQQNKARSVSS